MVEYIREKINNIFDTTSDRIIIYNNLNDFLTILNFDEFNIIIRDKCILEKIISNNFFIIFDMEYKTLIYESIKFITEFYFNKFKFLNENILDFINNIPYKDYTNTNIIDLFKYLSTDINIKQYFYTHIFLQEHIINKLIKNNVDEILPKYRTSIYFSHDFCLQSQIYITKIIAITGIIMYNIDMDELNYIFKHISKIYNLLHNTQFICPFNILNEEVLPKCDICKMLFNLIINMDKVDNIIIQLKNLNCENPDTFFGLVNNNILMDNYNEIVTSICKDKCIDL